MSGIWYIVLEYVSETTMINLVVSGEGMKLEIAKKYFKEMLTTLLYIKSKDISHRDIKLENMLLDNNYQLKFTDFGFASF
jgi:serine/threonine protein kinase